MLQPVNDCYWSPKPQRDDVPVTSASRHVALPELKHCEVPDSVLSIVSTLYYASLRHAALYRIFRATLRFLTLFRAIYASLRYTALYHAIYASLRFKFSALLCATLRFYESLRYTALHNDRLRYATPRYASLRYTALRCTTLQYAAPLCAILGYPALFFTLSYSINYPATYSK